MQKNNSKKDEILNVASELFLSQGYKGASVNEMSRRSGISKETFYRYFKSKQALFVAVLDKELQNYLQGLEWLDSLGEDEDMCKTLFYIGTMLLKTVLADRTMALRYLIFHETVARPEIGQVYYAHGPLVAYNALESYFNRQKKKGAVSRFDARTLGIYFTALILHKPVLEFQCGVIKKVKKEELDKYVKNVVKDFLSVYFERSQ